MSPLTPLPHPLSRREWGGAGGDGTASPSLGRGTEGEGGMSRGGCPKVEPSRLTAPPPHANARRA